MELEKLCEILDKKASEIDRNNDMGEVFEEVVNSGALALMVPKEYGGEGKGYYEMCEVAEKLAYYSAGVAHSVIVHGMAVDALRLFGNDEQKKKYLPKLMKSFGTLAITEPTGGSDVANAVRTTAEKKGDVYVINGNKTLITNGMFAELFIVIARTGEGAKGLTAFIVEKGDGIETTKIDLAGMRGSGLASVRFRDVEVPAENILVGEGKGMRVALGTLAPNRIPFAAMGIGIAQRCLDLAVERAKSREAFGGKLADLQAVQFMLAELAADIEALRKLIYGFAKDMGDTSYSGAICKLKAAEVAKKAADIAMEIHGGFGLLSNSKVEMAHRDAKVLDIAEGASEVMKLLIARKLFS
ncbi:acyl-CoA dehydrogenase family protein [Ferroglobus sp.]|uniref:acyl-CoA dehydrogenase family protein n=1 Tax=Ferroglobus sp. TaxID=2614230 RepID=UPI0025B93D3E|nr:acyl-CoA dehydrogenase family protein [Ferroglobus sp.]